jgi:hypothetical protein
MIGLLRRHLAAVTLALLLLAGAIAGQAAADRDQASKGGPALVSTDAGQRGALALALWLQRQGYRVDRPANGGQSPGDQVGIYFVLHPLRRVAPEDARAIVDWTRRGGTLVYAPSYVTEGGPSAFQPGDGLDTQVNLAPTIGRVGEAPGEVAPAFPFFSAPPVARFVASADTFLNPTDAAWIPLVEVDRFGQRRVLIAFRRYGAGQAIAIGSDAYLSNGHLGDADNAALILNMLARAGARRVALFDEYHHELVAQTDLITVARATPWGWAIAYAAATCLGFAFWSGRRFGPPIPRAVQSGRSTGDYVTAFAGLLQRGAAKGSATAWAQAQYSRLIRRELARSQRVRSDMPAPDLARILAERQPTEPAALSMHLAHVDGPPLGERALLDEIRELDPILRPFVRLENESGRRRLPPT